MAGITAAEVAPIVELIHGVRGKAESQFRANLVVSVATLTLLIDAGVITIAAAIERIQRTQRDMPEVFDHADVAIWIQWAIDLLQGEVPLHGSILQQQMQRTQRS